MKGGEDWQEYLHQKCNQDRNISWSRPVMKETVTNSMYLSNTQMLNQCFLSWQLRPPPQPDRDGDFQLKNWMLCDKEMLGCQLSVPVMKSRERWSIRVSAELLLGQEKKQHMGLLWKKLPRNRNGLIKLVILECFFSSGIRTSHHWRLGFVAPESQHKIHFLSMFLFFLTKWLVTRSSLSGSWGAGTQTVYLRGMSSWYL